MGPETKTCRRNMGPAARQEVTWYRDPCLLCTEWQTCVKTLPCPKFRPVKITPLYFWLRLMNIRAIPYVKFLPSTNEVWGKVIFSQASVILCREGSASERGSAPMEGGLHPGGWVTASRGLGRPPTQALRDTVNKRAVRVLLECAYLSALPLVAYLHCRKRTRVRTRIQIPISMVTLYYALHYINSESDPYRYCNHFWDG